MTRSIVSPVRGRHASTLLVAGVILALAAAPAWLRAHNQGIAALAVSAFFSRLCHQNPERSLALFGFPMAVCVRCFGIYVGAALGNLLRVERRTALICLASALALNALDVGSEALRLHGNVPLSRLLLGTALGISAGAMLSSGLKVAASSRIDCP